MAEASSSAPPPVPATRSGLIVALIALVAMLAVILFRPTPVEDVRRIDDTELTAADLRAYFNALDYRLADVRTGDGAVPRVDVAVMPEDIGGIRDTDVRKRLFFRTVLPLILMENARIEADRARVENWLAIVRADEPLRQSEIAAMNALTKEYRMVRLGKDLEVTLTALLRRMDVIPPSLALAQAAEESAWGRSRFTREGNALFGQWVWNDDAGITPEDRPDGASHSVRAFDDLRASVAAYMNNLNTHPAYATFRAARENLRQSGEAVTGTALVAHLRNYSERRDAYVKSLRALMRYNNLGGLDNATLVDGAAPPAFPMVPEPSAPQEANATPQG